MTAHQKKSGGRASVRRIVVLVALLCTGVMPAAGLRADDDSRPQPDVTVREARGVYSVSARFRVPQPAAIALAVLTDYEHIPRFMPGVKTSVVLERGAGRAVIEQEAVSHLMMFTKRVYLVLEIAEAPDSLRFHDRSGRSFTRYEGMWILCDENNGTSITYELTAEPSFDVPEFLVKRLLKRDSGQMIEGLRQEIAARATRWQERQ